MEDGKIIDLFFERSEQAIIELSEKYGPICLKLAENILGDRLDAEECVNDAYLGVWNAIPPQRPERLLSYVCRIVRNLAVKKYHGKTALKRNSSYDVSLDEIMECFPVSDGAAEGVDAAETADMIDRFLETLDARDRVMFVRRYWYADTAEDIAERFGTSGHYVSVRLSRMRKALKKYLIKEGLPL